MMDAVESDADELLFEPFLPSPPDSQSWDPSELYSDDEILQDYLEDSQGTLSTGSNEGLENSQECSVVVLDRYCLLTPVKAHLTNLGTGSSEK
jgi:hypothetical protein